MKTLKSFFHDETCTKIEYVKNDTLNEKFHVYRRDSIYEKWRKTDARKTLAEAEELANNPAKVTYMGIYENGVRKGMIDWIEPKEQKVLPPSVNSANFEYKEKRKSGTWTKEEEIVNDDEVEIIPRRRSLSKK